MDIDDVKEMFERTFHFDKGKGIFDMKATVPQTFHTGKLSGNRLNSSTLRSQFIVCAKQVWDDADDSVKRAFHDDQTIFVKKGDDEWDVHIGSGKDETGAPVFVESIVGIEAYLHNIMAKVGKKNDMPLQLITYGAPGTGKSHRVDALTNETNSVRVTFHPDTDYSTFVGSYKPTMAAQERYALDATGKTHKIDAKEKAISYSFVPQVFLKAYVEAWRRWCDAALPDEEKRCYLVIEEINRGNCAQIFGDMFQLLDRCESGWSCYAVAPDDDIQSFLREDAKYGLGGLAWTDNVVNDEGKTIATAEQIKTGARMVLPPNLCILATMNTSDQSLFPIDSAFKRRWDWEYVPITEGKDKNGEPLGWKICPVEKTEDIAEETPEYDWWDFVRGVNARISAATRSEDKKIGYFFAKPEAADGKKVVTAKKILTKVIFYLWNDVFKDLGPAKIFSRNGKGVEFNEFYGEDGKMNVDLVHEFVEMMVGKADTTPAQQG